MPKVDFLKGRAPTILALVAGTVAAIIIFTAIRDHQSSEANVAFSLQASSHANIIVEGFSRAFFAIESVGALYGSSDSISSSQFDDFVAPLLARFPTITALGWAPEVRQIERAEFEQSTQKLFPDFLITERNPRNQMVAAAERQVYFPVHFIRPYEGNEAARGFDLYSNEIRRAAIDQARASGQTTSTARIRLVQERGHQNSVLLINPVFQNGAFSEDPDKFLGVASAVYRIGDGVEKALSQVHPAGLDIWLIDRSAEPDKQFLYFHPSRAVQAEQQNAESMPPANARQYVHEFDLGGRTFNLILSPVPGYFDTGGGYLAWFALTIGLGFTVLFAAYLELMRRRSRELMAGQRALEQQINERIFAEQQLQEANRNLENLSRTDPVMEIANRRSFDEYLQQEWRRAVRDGTSLSLLIGDVDHFKAYNDTYGHVAGDRCLQKIASILSDIVDRPGDLVARYGGEEIAVVLPSTPEFGAHDLAEKLRLAVAGLALPHEQSPVAEVVTMSIGCGTASPTRESSLDEFIHAVDIALYLAKQQGRNRTVVDKTMSQAELNKDAS